ncbi:hypothetical protein quinque_008011 [Culex quinquefasciatus]
MKAFRLGLVLAVLCAVAHANDDETILCPEGECVKLHLCLDGEINDDGTNLIDIRFNPDDPCEHYLLKCCKVPKDENEGHGNGDSSTDIVIPPPSGTGNVINGGGPTSGNLVNGDGQHAQEPKLPGGDDSHGSGSNAGSQGPNGGGSNGGDSHGPGGSGSHGTGVDLIRVEKILKVRALEVRELMAVRTKGLVEARFLRVPELVRDRTSEVKEALDLRVDWVATLLPELDRM